MTSPTTTCFKPIGLHAYFYPKMISSLFISHPPLIVLTFYKMIIALKLDYENQKPL